MEQEYDEGQFQLRTHGGLRAISEPAAASRAPSFLHSTSGSGVVRELSASLYALLDSLVSARSYAVDDSYDGELGELFETLEILEREGIVESVSINTSFYHDAPRFFRFSLVPRLPAGSTDGREIKKSCGYGFWDDPATALAKAIGEFLERYFLLLYKNDRLMMRSVSELRAERRAACDLRLVAGFSEEQKKESARRRWSDESRFRWEEAVRVSSGARVLVPAQLLYWNYAFGKNAEEPFLREGNTNGCGGMFSRSGAILSALYELIERDAFLLQWLKAASPLRIDPASVSDRQFRSLLGRTLRYGFRVHCLVTTSDIAVPSFVAVVEDPSGAGPHFSVGGGCNLDPERALTSAFMEAWAVYHWNRKRKWIALPDPYRPFLDSSMGQDERLLLWANPAMSERFSFFLKGAMRQFRDAVSPAPHSSGEDAELREVVRRVEEKGEGYEVYAFLPEHRILQAVGYHSARVVVPRLVPLYLTETNAPLGAARLRGAASPNPLPHPFP